MAESLAHRWGQIIGDVFESFVLRLLTDVANRHALYLDHKGPRKARAGQGGKNLSKVTWQDGYGNRHDLDYVLERDGTEDALGTPIAFVESAWRRYTKHSKNKVQEIEAAVWPVAQTFSRHQPFCGAVLAGEFTGSALAQLESKGFAVLHIPYASIVTAFAELGIDASSEDGIHGTSEDDFRKKIAVWGALSQPDATDAIVRCLARLHAGPIRSFVSRLEASLTRRVTAVRLSVLRGHALELPSVESAIAYLVDEEQSWLLREDAHSREYFEIQVRFNTGARIEATFPARSEAIAFLRSFD